MGIKLVITVGLPGSGKTTYCKEVLCQKYPRSNYICVDEVSEEYPNDTLEEIVHDNYSGRSVVIVDALLLTNSDIVSMTKLFNDVSSLEIHWWEPDVEACLKNDSGRRKKDSIITIKSASVEPININYIKRESGIRVVNVEKHVVYKRSVVEEACVKNHIATSDGKFYSDEWTLGGSWRNCWGDSGTVDGEEEPEFKSFDNLLMKMFPNVSFLQYKRLRSDSVKRETGYNSDYYGGSTEVCKFVCDVRLLEKSLIEIGLIESTSN